MRETIRKLAKDLGFISCGFTTTGPLTGEGAHLEQWLNAGFHGEMKYMENHFDKRLDPSLLVEGARTAISLLFPYYPQKIQDPTSYQIAKYAYGEDYHIVIKEKLQLILDEINRSFGPVEGRCFTDSAPILERPLAVRAGLGWIGRNSLLISREAGSFVFLSEIFIDLAIEPDEPFIQNYCGNCRKCVENCPTSAIIEDGVIDSTRCLSYWTIEQKGDIPSGISELNQNRIYGCDICQDVCPWNSKAQVTTEERFRPYPELLEFTNDQWMNLSEDEYRRLFKGSAVKRAKYSGLKRNISAVLPQP